VLHMKALCRCFDSTSKKCQPRTDDATTEAITEAAELSDARPSDDGDTRLAITLMTRKPHRFDWWLRYHKSLGVCHFFIHVEDTPELLELLDSDEFRGFVTVTSGEDASPDNYYTLQQRQEAQVRRSLKLCRVQRIPWLLHIDDDEILHLDVPFSAITHHAPEGVSSLVFINLEAVPHRLGSHCAFEDITTFTLHKMLAYRNGKAAGRTSLARWQGPHRFSGESHIVSVEARHPPIPLSPASSPLLVASPAMRQGAHPSALALLWAAGRVCPPLRVMHLRGLAQQVPQAPPHRRARDEGHPIRVLPRLHLPLPVRPNRRAERGSLGGLLHEAQGGALPLAAHVAATAAQARAGAAADDRRRREERAREGAARAAAQRRTR